MTRTCLTCREELELRDFPLPNYPGAFPMCWACVEGRTSAVAYEAGLRVREMAADCWVVERRRETGWWHELDIYTSFANARLHYPGAQPELQTRRML